jgi:hypothetical protein
MKNKLHRVWMAGLLLVLANFAHAQSHTCDLSCSPTTFAARVYGTSMFSNLTSDKYSSEETKKYGYNVGGDLIWYYLNKGNFKANISIGASISDYRTTRWLNTSSNYTTKDVDGQTVNVSEIANNFGEDQNYRTVDIPVKLGFEYSVAEMLDVFVNVGCSYGYNWDESYTNYTTLTRTGYYPIYNVTLYDIPYSAYYYPKEVPKGNSGTFGNMNNISVEATAGLKIKLNTQFSITCGVKWLQGMNSIKSNDANPMLLNANSSYSLNSLSTRDDKVKTWGLGLELGLAMNLSACKKIIP